MLSALIVARDGQQRNINHHTAPGVVLKGLLVTEDEVRALPVVTDVPTAGRPFGLSRDTAYRHARAGTFPVPVLRVGRKMIVTRASLLDALGLDER